MYSRDNCPGNQGCFEKNPVRILSKAIRVANDQIRRKAKEDETLYGMGTTVVAATCLGHYLQVANVGDSRLYIINKEIRQITRDHSLVEEMIRMGELTARRQEIIRIKILLPEQLAGWIRWKLTFS